MNTSQLLRAIESDEALQDYCLGVFPCDRLPAVDRNPACVIANTDPHTKSGTHWVAFYIEDDKCEFFDSYGRLPYNKHFVQFMRPYRVQYSNVQVQAPLSSACGQHVLHYLYHRCRGDSEILNCYTKDLTDNDDTVSDFVWDLCDITVPPIDHEFLYHQIARMLSTREERVDA